MGRIYLSPPHMGTDEITLLRDAFESNWIAPLGPHVDAFERELAAAVGVEHAAALSSGTAGLHLGLLIAGVQPGDRVVTSSLTFAATANAITYAGAVPVFVDVDPRTWTLDPDAVAEAMDAVDTQGHRVGALISVDLYGQLCDYAALQAVCRARDVPLVEDAAEALGSHSSEGAAGSFGDMAVFSFNGNKIITTSGGGMLVARDAAVTERARFLATQARDPAPHYQHSTIGFNYRMSNLLAAVGRGQLRVLQDRVAARRRNRDAYREGLSDLPGITFLEDPPGVHTNAWLTCITVEPEAFGADREAIRLHLEADDIESRPVWKPMHLQPVFEDCEMFGGSVSESLFAKGLCLPSGSSLTDGDLQRIVTRFRTVSR
ncbi:MAG: aminotransferase class I/II-fold pyridoxal phosphate-dependent enzyme [Myxococcales bacterium]|nr:aminotransferase class I/II-fold pyridoxal phosphate-dependent enzyme [Myxococcales bacterium]